MSNYYNLFTWRAHQLKFRLLLAFFFIITSAAALSADCNKDQLVSSILQDTNKSPSGDEQITLNAKASERIEVEFGIQPKNGSTAIHYGFKNKADEIIYSVNKSVYTPSTFKAIATGDASECGHPAIFFIKADSGSFNFPVSVTIKRFEIGINSGTGLNFTTAQVTPNNGSLCGHINFPLNKACNTQHYFKVTLPTDETQQLIWTFSCEPQHSVYVEVDLMDEKFNLVKQLHKEAVYGSVESKSSFTNKNTYEKIYYLKLSTSGPGDLAYELKFNRIFRLYPKSDFSPKTVGPLVTPQEAKKNFEKID